MRFCDLLPPINSHADIYSSARGVKSKDSLNMEFAFKYGIWEFLILDLTPETQLLAAIGYGTDLNFLCLRDQLQIIFDRKILWFMFFERVYNARVEWENALNLCIAHPLKKDKLQNISVVYDF